MQLTVCLPDGEDLLAILDVPNTPSQRANTSVKKDHPRYQIRYPNIPGISEEYWPQMNEFSKIGPVQYSFFARHHRILNGGCETDDYDNDDGDDYDKIIMMMMMILIK